MNMMSSPIDDTWPVNSVPLGLFFANVSKNSVAKDAQGSSNYYPDVIFKKSNYPNGLQVEQTGVSFDFLITPRPRAALPRAALISK